jgi:hypothetical protein
MPNFCLLPDKVSEFRKALKEKEITIPDLLKMSSEERTNLLKKYAGDSASQVNTLFEEKLLLKNRMLGIKNWASKMGEIGKYSPEKKAQISQAISEYRAAQQERIFNPKENETFLANVAEKQLGTDISQEEAKNVFELSQKVNDLKEGFDPKTEQWKTPEAKASYGAAKVVYENYVSELKGEGEPFMEMVKGRIDEFNNEPYKPTAVLNLGKDSLRALSDNIISLVASVDNSFLGRQGLKVLMTHPTAWVDGAYNSFLDAFKTIGGKETMDALMGDIYSRPNYLNGSYEKAGVISTSEEQYPSSILEKVPGLGRIFKASEVAFKGSALRMRTDLYDLMSDMAKNNGLKINESLIKDMGKVVNSLTARGKWGKYGESPIVKLLLWSPRMLKGNLDILTAHGFGVGLENNFARKEAFKNVLKIVGTITTLLMIARAMKKDSTEFDTTSSNFGDIVVNDTKMSRILGTLADFVGISSSAANGKQKFDVTGGMNSLIIFASREIQNKQKSAATGVTTPYSADFGAQSRFSAAIDFLTGKTQPLVSGIISWAKGNNYQNEKPTIKSTAYNMLIPISIQNILGINQTSKPKEVKKKGKR